MGFGRKILLLATLIAGFSVSVELAYADTSCVSRFAQLAKQAVKAAPKWLANQQKNYWRDVWDTRGRRLILATRDDPEKFHWLYAVDDPFSEIGSAVKHKVFKKDPFRYRLSLPVVMGAWGYGISQLDKKVEDSLLLQVLEKEEKNPASPYLIQLWQMGVLEPKEMLDVMNAHTAQLNAFLAGKQKTAIHQRITNLEKAGVLQTEKEVALFTDYLRKTENKILRNSAKTQDDNNIVNEMYQTLRRELKIILPKKSARDYELMLFALLPEVKVLNQKDLVLARKALESPLFLPIVEEFGLPYAMSMVGATDLEKNDEILARKKKAEKIPVIAGLPQARKQFLERVEIPAYRSKMNVTDIHGTKMELDSELARWQAFLTDPRFSPYASVWRNGKISDIDAMRVFARLSAAYENFYQIVKTRPTPGAEDVCQLVLDQGEGAVLRPLFANVERILEDVKAKALLQGGQEASCRESLLRLQWQFNKELAEDAVVSEARAKAMNAKIAAQINESCLAEAAKKFISSCVPEK